jgi:translation initiation factor 1
MADKPLYSTAVGFSKADKDGRKSDGYKPSAGPLKMRLETNGRGGKAVTVLFQLTFAEDEARRVMKELQSQLGCGATLKDREGVIELQGDRRDRVEAYFKERGQKLVRAGG